MSDLPSIDLVTPSFNHAAYIGETIRSVLDQQYPRLDYRVLDAASTDGSVDVLRSFGPSLQWTSEPDAGQADAIRRGLSKGSGEIIGWLNSDDRLKPGALAEAAAYLRDHPEIALVYGDADFIRADGSDLCPCANPQPFSRHRLRHYSDYIVQPAAFFRRSAYEAVGGIDASLHYAMDYDLWLKLADRFQAAYVPRVWAEYRWLGENKSAVGAWRRINEVRAVAQRHGISRLPAHFRLEAVNQHLHDGKAAWRAGHAGRALTSLAAAAGNLVASPRAIKSLFESQTRRLIRTGKILRASTG